jgi:hypothetical protein
MIGRAISENLIARLLGQEETTEVAAFFGTDSLERNSDVRRT